MGVGPFHNQKKAMAMWKDRQKEAIADQKDIITLSKNDYEEVKRDADK